MDKIAASLDNKLGYVVFNPTSFATDGIVKIDGKTVIAKNIPPNGYALRDSFVTKNSVSLDGKKVETNRLSVEFDDAWQIVSIYDKESGRQVLKKGGIGNQLRVYADYPDTYDAWEWQEYSLSEYKAITAVESVETISDGARFGIKIVRPFMRSKITQTIWFMDDSAKIDFETVADWHDTHKMLKVAFPVDVNTDKATFDIQFGSIERPTHKNTSWDKAKFETCAHKFADLSEGNYGVSLLNDCKYGHDVHDGLMMLSLLRSPTDPNPVADQGEMLCTYSLLPHAGSLAQSDTIKQAYLLNQPLTALKASGEKNLIPAEYSAVSVDNECLVCDTVKEEENGEGTIIRLYESKNTRGKATLTTSLKAEKAYLCDLMENELRELEIKDGKILIDFKGFEIITVKLV